MNKINFLFAALMCFLTISDAYGRCPAPRCAPSRPCYGLSWLRGAPQQEALRTCCVNCRVVHFNWMQKCAAGSSRNYDACKTVANTDLTSCLSVCMAPKKTCFTLPDASKGRLR